MKKLTIALSSIAAVDAAVPAAAQDQSRMRNALSSVYIGADVGQAKYKDGCRLTPGCDDNDTSWGLFAGYRFNPYLAAEIGYHDLGSISAPVATIDGQAIELVGVGSVPLNNAFSVYGKLGGYRGEAKGLGISETNNDWTYGLGVQYDVTPYIGVRGEWQRYADLGGGGFNATTDVDVLRVGALWRFR
jgi:OOP family OmpA-OmpF porin